MISISIIIFALLLHWVGDFLFQNDEMAINKSSSFKWLGIHSLVYTCVLFGLGWKIALINGIAHFFIDGITSRITKYFWNKEDRHNFFVTIGFDQVIHLSLLFYTLDTFK